MDEPEHPEKLAPPQLGWPRVPRWRSLRRSFALARDPLSVLDDLLARYGAGTLELFIGGMEKSVLTRDPGLTQHILQKNHRNYAKSKFTQGFSRYIGHGLLTNDGPDWLRQRRLIQPGFHRQRVAGLTGLMQQITQHERPESHGYFRALRG